MPKAIVNNNNILLIFMNKINSHPNQLYANELADICRPLERLNINYFGHAQVDPNGRFAGLNNHPGFMDHYLKNGYFNADIHMAQHSQLGKYVLWDNIVLDKESEKMSCEAIEFGLDHTFTIIETDMNGMQYYHFSSNLIGNSINQEYFRNLDLLERFILYFKEQIQTSKNLNTAYSTTYLLSQDSPKFLAESNQPEIITNQRELFLQQIKLRSAKHISHSIFSNESINYIRNYFKGVLSQRETDCLLHTLLGKTAKITANDLGISRRTVEEHLASIKNKINVYSKAELIEKVITILS